MKINAKKYVIITGCLLFVSEVFAETWNCGPATDGVYSDSVKCTYDEATKTFTIAGEGPMGNFPWIPDQSTETPWRDKDIVHAVIEGNVTTIGDRVFKRLYNLQDIKGTENITSIGEASFSYTALTSANFSNAEYVERAAFYDVKDLEYINLSNDVRFGPVQDAYAIFGNTKIPDCETGICANCGDKFVQAGVGCVSSCYTGYTSYYGFCTRTRYTLPEADAATSNDNENTIEWIFE